MKQQEQSQFKEEIDAWIKSFKRDLESYSSDMDDVTDDIRSHNEELQFQFENLCRIETRIDKLEDTFERILEVLETTSGSPFKNEKISHVEMLKDKF